LQNRKPADIFHSRLEVSKNNQSLLSKGWVWQPLDVIQIYNIADCFTNPNTLDNLDFELPLPVMELCTASFIDESRLLIGSTDKVIDSNNLPSKSFAVWNFTTNIFSTPIVPGFEFGNLFSIDDNFAWDTYKFPKIVNLNTGEIEDADETVYSGEQNSSIIYDLSKQPQIVFNRQRNRLAIKDKDKIVVMTRI